MLMTHKSIPLNGPTGRATGAIAPSPEPPPAKTLPGWSAEQTDHFVAAITKVIEQAVVAEITRQQGAQHESL